MTPNEMKKAIKLGAKLGVARLRLGEFEVEYFPSAAPSVSKPQTLKTSKTPKNITPTVADPIKPNGRLPSDEDFLFMASPFGPTMNEAGLVVEDEPGQHEED